MTLPKTRLEYNYNSLLVINVQNKFACCKRESKVSVQISVT